MAAFDFPASPTDGQQYTANNVTYTWSASQGVWNRNREERGAAQATGAGGDQIFYLNGQTITTSYTIPAGSNAMTAGPVTVDPGVSVTVGSGDTWTVV